jgi:hypothetical protein
VNCYDPATQICCDDGVHDGSACCIALGDSGCQADGDCCQGVCQAGTCYASIAGTCSGGDYCSGGGAVTCSGSFGCNCTVTSSGQSICVAGYHCDESCDACGGGICDEEETQCCGPGQITCLYPCPPEGGGCFTGETRIAMADGSTRPITEVEVGDAVVSATGAINHVLAVRHPLLGNRPLYALDDSGYFVTASHPFLTDDGWKSIDPAATAREHSALQVGRLQIGDRVHVLRGVLASVASGIGTPNASVELDIASVTVTRIETMHADPATQLYDLQLDGDHTFIANDLVVHNK